jgi:hypothetical protein
MLIICGMAYRVSPIAQVAVWFTQLIYTLMFLRDVLSIIENLSEAGVTGLGIFKRAVSKKLEEYMDETEENGGHDSHQTAHHEQNEQTRADAEGSAGTGDSLDRGGAEKSLGDPR